MNIQILTKLTEIINLKIVCEKAGLTYRNIWHKIKKQNQLNVDEVEKIQKVFSQYGISDISILETTHSLNPTQIP